MKMKNVFNKSQKHQLKQWEFLKTLLYQLESKILQEQMYTIYGLSPFFFYMEAKFGSSNKRIKRLTSIKTKFFRTVGYTRFDHKTKEEILEQLKVQPVDEKLRRYKSNWLHYVTRMNKKMSKIMLNYGPNGRQLG